MKIIDILNNIANNKKVPKKIKYGDVIWEFNGSNYEDKTKDLDSCKRFLFGKHNLNILNIKVEIIEDKDIEEIKQYKQYLKYLEESEDNHNEIETVYFENMSKILNELVREVNKIKKGLK